MNKDNVANNGIPEMEDYGNREEWDREDMVADQLPGSNPQPSAEWDREDVVADQLPGSNPQPAEDWDPEDMAGDRGSDAENKKQGRNPDHRADDWNREDMVADGLNNPDYNAQGRGVGDQPAGSSGSGQFGEFENTGTGVDLTKEMDSNKADVRSGLVKGGQPGEDGEAGLAQYGGEAGDIPPQGNIDGNK